MQKRILEHSDPILMTEAVTASFTPLVKLKRLLETELWTPANAPIIINEAVYIAINLIYSASTPCWIFLFFHQSKTILFRIKASGVRWCSSEFIFLICSCACVYSLGRILLPCVVLKTESMSWNLFTFRSTVTYLACFHQTTGDLRQHTFDLSGCVAFDINKKRYGKSSLPF